MRTALPEAPVPPVPAHLASAAPIEFSAGFDSEEGPGTERFRWLGARGALTFASAEADRFLELAVLSEFFDLSQTLTINAGTRTTCVELARGWMPLATVIPAGAARVDVSVNKLFPAGHHARDSRELSIRVRGAVLHEDQARHRRVSDQQANILANTHEMLAGMATLRSTPPNLGIDMCGACNVNPPCVFCEWDWSKSLEGDFVDAPFTLDTLREWGPLFDNSVSLLNCSIGEPFMMKNVDELLDAFSDGGKYLEITTNGQILTDRNIQALLGRQIAVQISLDAGTPETYAKLRNARFRPVLDNLRRLIATKGGPDHWPMVNVVFMPMKLNVHELDRFVEICAELRVDRLILRPLNYSDKLELNWDRAGYRFEYQRELLPVEELIRVSGRAAELCRRYGVELSDQLDFGGSVGTQFERLFEEGRASVAPTGREGKERRDTTDAQPQPEKASTVEVPAARAVPTLGAEKTPACTEPWKSLYILRRGVFPCCYGGLPVAPMDQYREAWNSPLMQAIRTALTRGRFHDYCLQSPACAIVRKSLEAHDLRLGEELRMRWRHIRALFVRRAWRPFKLRVLHPSRWACQFAAIRLKRFATDPGYVPRLLKRVVRKVRSA